jgi:hypothetical protein
MLAFKKSILAITLANIALFASAGYAATTHHLQKQTDESASPRLSFNTNNKSFFYISALYVTPSSDNLKYATFVSGIQPYYQSWHYQSIDPNYHPAFELGYNYAIPSTEYSAAIYWTHINTDDSAYKQASNSTDLTTVEFVAPPFEMSPPVFGIKRADSKVNFSFDNVLLNASKQVEYTPKLQSRFFGGIAVLNLNQTITTTFSDYAGTPATPYSYPLPPDPLFSFQLQNVSKYLGAGPDLGFSFRYEMDSHFGVLGQFLGILTAGIIKTQDNFTSSSTRLTNLGIATSHQQITAPDATQVVLGADGKLGLFYHYQKVNFADLTFELGYRMADYLNAISTVNPGTLVQPGTVLITPEFSTGTMAIVSTDAKSHPFSFNGPFFNVILAIN